MPTYKKPYLTFEQQLELLISRGLTVSNPQQALKYLKSVGYYRLSAYWYLFRELIPSSPAHLRRKDPFIPGATFEDAISLYAFDKKLRLLVLDAIESIEVALRVDIAYLLCAKDAFAYKNPDLLHGNFTKKIDPITGKTNHEKWLEKHTDIIKRSKEEFVKHYITKYSLPLPIWVTIELWDFGLLSSFYKGMKVNDKTYIADKYNVSDWQIMESWLRSLNYVRNVAAHHCRLWNRNLVDQPKLPKKGKMDAFDPLIGKHYDVSRIYTMLCIIAFFLKNIYPASAWPSQLVGLIQTFPEIDGVDISHMGFSRGWEMLLFWKYLDNSLLKFAIQ